MNNMFVGSIITGYAVALLVHSLIKTVKKSDEQHGLPQKLYIKDYIYLFLCGASSYKGISTITIILFFVTVYLSFMAYTDRYTSKVYSAASYLFFVPGICLLIFPDVQREPLISLLFFAIVVVVGFFIKAYAWGDVQVFVAVCPYILILPSVVVGKVEIDNLLMLLLLFLSSLIVTIISSIKFKPFGMEKKRPMVPAITFVVSVMLYVFKFV